jgi:gamma-glutamyltranspeptidase/glutathione hydrolase
MIHNDAVHSPYASKRTVSFAKKAMVATSQPLAAQIGLDIIKQGGNAIDAAIATAAALTVVEPTGNGIGGDAFALVWVNNKLHGLNASGQSPNLLTPEAVGAQGHCEMPLYGWTPVTVPGAPAAWAALSEKFGKLPFAELLQPAIDLAREGFPVSPTISYLWQKAAENFKHSLTSPETQHWFEVFTIQGKAPKAGQIFKCEAQARTLSSIAQSKAESFYRGELAQKIDHYSQKTGGYIRREDLAKYQVEWVEPVKVNYKGYDIWEIPPNGQGMVALMALNMLNTANFECRESVDTYHQQIEAMKLAYTDGQTHITQADKMKISVESLLSQDYADERRALITERAIQPTAGEPKSGGTVYLACADDEGNMVSFIQSNYHGFGSGVVIPDTGIAMQNRGHNFSLDPNHVNYLAPNKKTFHTIIPGFISKDNQAVGPFGVMGGFMQPQGHMQVVMNMIDFKLNPQAALDAPRWQWMANKRVGVEHQVPLEISQGLAAKGHDIEIAFDLTSFGRGQIIIKDPQTGVLQGGTESRTDGHIASW